MAFKLTKEKNVTITLEGDNGPEAVTFTMLMPDKKGYSSYKAGQLIYDRKGRFKGLNAEAALELFDSCFRAVTPNFQDEAGNPIDRESMDQIYPFIKDTVVSKLLKDSGFLEAEEEGVEED